MHQVPREDQIELADAIAEGARRRPQQAFGEYFSDDGGSCALGAAYEGAYVLPTIRRRRTPFVHGSNGSSIASKTFAVAAPKAATNGCRSMQSSCT